MECEYENCDKVFNGTKSECLKEYDLHVGAKHAAAKTAEPEPSGATATVKTEDKKKTQFRRSNLQSSKKVKSEMITTGKSKTLEPTPTGQSCPQRRCLKICTTPVRLL